MILLGCYGRSGLMTQHCAGFMTRQCKAGSTSWMRLETRWMHERTLGARFSTYWRSSTRTFLNVQNLYLQEIMTPSAFLLYSMQLLTLSHCYPWYTRCRKSDHPPCTLVSKKLNVSASMSRNARKQRLHSFFRTQRTTTTTERNEIGIAVWIYFVSVCYYWPWTFFFCSGYTLRCINYNTVYP